MNDGAPSPIVVGIAINFYCHIRYSVPNHWVCSSGCTFSLLKKCFWSRSKSPLSKKPSEKKTMHIYRVACVGRLGEWTVRFSFIYCAAYDLNASHKQATANALISTPLISRKGYDKL